MIRYCHLPHLASPLGEAKWLFGIELSINVYSIAAQTNNDRVIATLPTWLPTLRSQVVVWQ